MLSPPVRESHGGTRLLRRADINTSSHVTTFFRVRCKLSDPSTEKRATGAIEKRHVTYFGECSLSNRPLLPCATRLISEFSSFLIHVLVLYITLFILTRQVSKTVHMSKCLHSQSPGMGEFEDIRFLAM